MNFFTIIAGLAVLGLSAFVGYISVTLLIQGGMTPIFGGVAMAIVAVLNLALGILLIGLGWSGIVSNIRKGRA